MSTILLATIDLGLDAHGHTMTFVPLDVWKNPYAAY
jgi:hypothetical protein